MASENKTYMGSSFSFSCKTKMPKRFYRMYSTKTNCFEISKSLTGCDETLYWWVTKALEPADPTKKETSHKKEKKARDYNMDDLPEMCLDVIHSK